MTSASQTPQPSRNSKRLWYIAGAFLAVLVLAIAGAFYFLFQDDDPGLATSAPDLPTPTRTAATAPTDIPVTTPPTQSSGQTPAVSPTEPPGASPTTASPTDTPPPAASGASHFVIDPAQSTAIFVVETTVLGFKSTSVANASEVNGEFHVSPQGLDSSGPSTYQMDMRTLTSDNALLRSFLSSGAFDTDNYPLAEFVAQSSSQFPAEYGTGEQFTFTLNGTLDMNGVSQPVTWQVLARQSGEFFSATADTDLALSQFNVEVPDTPLGGADDTVHVQITMIAVRS
jgi:polyisoprenoid-binding protein YceI